MSQDLNKILVFPKSFTLFLYVGIAIGFFAFEVELTLRSWLQKS